MSKELAILLTTAISIGFFHPLLGPDHYVPFIVMAKSRKWSYLKTIIITVLCGFGHVGSSVILGLLGIFLGLSLEKLGIIEASRGSWAAWALIGFGLAYFIYGLRQAHLNKPHKHFHLHSDGETHVHKHIHRGEHAHLHEKPALAKPVPWALFVIFVLGPCEPLIPILMYPALKQSFTGMLLVASVFGITTITTMLIAVLGGTFGFSFISLHKVERYSHAVAGLAIFFCGVTIEFLGL